MSTYPKLTPGINYLIQRASDGKYLAVFGWSVEWIDAPSHGCPRFNSINLGAKRADDWHLNLYHTCRECNFVEEKSVFATKEQSVTKPGQV